MRNILVIGHSHIGAIRSAAVTRREAGGGESWTRTIHLLDPRFEDGTGEKFNANHTPPLLREHIRDQIERHSPLVASAMGGNAHALISMVRSDAPFDFNLTGEPSPRLDPAAEIIPEQEVRKRLLGVMENDLDRITRLRREIGPFWQIESPPPVAARSFIEKRIEPYFRDMPEFKRNGISPGGLRYRVWRLSCRILRDHCRSLGCGYIPTPAGVFDGSGFLAQSFANDSTHGNERYGEQIIAALETLALKPIWTRHLSRTMDRAAARLGF